MLHQVLLAAAAAAAAAAALFEPHIAPRHNKASIIPLLFTHTVAAFRRSLGHVTKTFGDERHY
jgi:hypothetical protein